MREEWEVRWVFGEWWAFCPDVEGACECEKFGTYGEATEYVETKTEGGVA